MEQNIKGGGESVSDGATSEVFRGCWFGARSNGLGLSFPSIASQWDLIWLATAWRDCLVVPDCRSIEITQRMRVCRYMTPISEDVQVG